MENKNILSKQDHGQKILLFNQMLYLTQIFLVSQSKKYQPSGAGGTRSPPAPPHRLQHLTARLIQNGRRGLERSTLGYLTLRSTFAK